MLNTLDLAASAVGNHEFDVSFDHLTTQIKEWSQFPYLGANVYTKGTTTPALDEYTVIDVDGVAVGVIGAVTEETPSLVTPGGIADIEFGDPVDAVNRVAEQLTDGDDTNGEADVIVALYHEGASAGTPDGSTLEEEIDAGECSLTLRPSPPQKLMLFSQVTLTNSTPGSQTTTAPNAPSSKQGPTVTTLARQC